MIYKQDKAGEHFYRQHEDGSILHVCVFKEDGERWDLQDDVVIIRNTKKGSSTINSLEKMPGNLIESAAESFNVALAEAVTNLKLSIF